MSNSSTRIGISGSIERASCGTPNCVDLLGRLRSHHQVEHLAVFEQDLDHAERCRRCHAEPGVQQQSRRASNARRRVASDDQDVLVRFGVEAQPTGSAYSMKAG